MWSRGDRGSWRAPSRKGSAMMRAESKSGYISGPNVLMTSVTSLDKVARFSRSLVRVLADVGFSDSIRGRRDLTMSMPVSPIRRAAKVIDGKKTTPNATTSHKGTQFGM